MSCQTASLLVAGQLTDSAGVLYQATLKDEAVDTALPSDIETIYGHSGAIMSWANAIYSDAHGIAKPHNFTTDCIYTFPFHPFRDPDIASPLSEDSESDESISFCFDGSAWVSALPPTLFDNSEDSTSTSAHSDDEAQYISIPSDSPWYRPPLSPSPEVITALHELCSGTYPNSCSSEVRQIIAQQKHLLNIFHEELYRIIPDGLGYQYDSDWLDDIDPELVLAPVESFEDICWQSAVSERSPARRLTRPLPDVPVGFGDVHSAF